ncbi:MAG: hypothetical protein EOO88_13975 [Pedobacter sp.]|nr:MAG: hypothetical protein EOO88_13975 [Pedobacter sp.]
MVRMEGQNAKNMGGRKQIVIFLVLVAPIVYVLSGSNKGEPVIEGSVAFKKRLSSYHLFQGEMSAMNPSVGVELFELSSTLFTDYAEKQRLIRLPEGKKMKLTENGLPVFPEGTLIAKTFYYPSKTGRKTRMVDTRLLIYERLKWNVATYRWNKEQTDAVLLENGATVELEIEDPSGKPKQLAYRIPSSKECVSCHRSGSELLAIGPKVMNLNRIVERGGKRLNQLEYLMNKGLFESRSLDSFKRMPAYTDSKLPIQQRARAYMDINCAHCHRPGGNAGHTMLVLDYGIGLESSGILRNKNNIIIRMSEMGDYHMPKLGTTVIDTGGVELVKSYLKNIK